MAPRKPFRKKPEEFKARNWLPRGAHFTVYDIQGTAISEALTKEIEAAVTAIVAKYNVPTLAVDVKKG
jgi:hypothetical protein